MNTGEKFYTDEQRRVLSEKSKGSMAWRTPMSEAMGALVLDALGEQVNALQDINGILRGIGEAVSAQYAVDASKEDFIKAVESSTPNRGEQDFAVIEFKEKPVTKIAFAKTKDIAIELMNGFGLKMCYPSRLADFGEDKGICVLADY